MIIKGIDCAVRISKQTADKLAAEGYKFVCRYLPGASKNMTRDEVQVLTDAGLLILSVYETTADRAAGGAANGKTDGADALKLARQLGMPEHGCIYFAVDYEPSTAALPTVIEYIAAAAEQIKPYKAGVYGPYKVIEYLASGGLCAGYWQAYAWSGGKTSVYNTVHQLSPPQTVAGISADLDEAYTYRGLWNYNTTAEAVALADELELSSPDYWGRVMQGKAALKSEYLEQLIVKAATRGINGIFDKIKAGA
jgi:hypothetical protein